jgi:hypothetical protein
MHNGSKWLRSLLMGSVLIVPAVVAGCAEHATYRVYDPYYSDYHVWDRNEVVYYQRWESETHRDHRDFKARNADEQKQYWTWRHSHSDQH